MSKHPKPTTPLDEKLIEAWRKGGLAPYTIGPLDSNTAKSFRHRMYRTRRAMQAQNHPDVALANKATIALTSATELGKLIVIIHPSNHLIDEALAKAGITTNDPPPLDE